MMRTSKSNLSSLQNYCISDFKLIAVVANIVITFTFIIIIMVFCNPWSKYNLKMSVILSIHKKIYQYISYLSVLNILLKN